MQRGPGRAVLLAVSFVLLVACGAGRPTAAPPTAAPTAATPLTLPATPTTPAQSSSPGPQPVTFAFAGDTQFGDQQDTEASAVSTGLPLLADRAKTDPAGVLRAISPTLSSADLTVVNLETAVTEGGTAVAGKRFHFRSPAASFDVLRSAGVDVATMANNHALDYGPQGLQDTLTAAGTANFPVIGVGRNADEAFRPYRTTIKGQRIAVLSAVDWLEPALVPGWTATATRPGLAFSIDPTRLLAAVRSVRSQVDTLVVFMHWGTEQDQCADARQQSLARALTSAGADIVVGAHSHRVQGAGRLGPAFVAYGLGNFTWWREDGESGRTGVLRVTATGRHVDAYSWVPARIRRGVPVPLAGPAAVADLDEWERRRGCTGLSP